MPCADPRPLLPPSCRVAARAVATNALLERKGSPFGLVLTAGFADLLEIGDQTRPDLFDLAIANKAKVLYSPADVVQAKERVTMEGWTLNPAAPSVDQILADGQADTTEAGEVRLGLSGEAVRILEPLGASQGRRSAEHSKQRVLTLAPFWNLRHRAHPPAARGPVHPGPALPRRLPAPLVDVPWCVA